MKDKCKILILSDINDTTINIIKNGVNLAKMVGAEVNFLCVKKPTEIIEKESQLSAMRSINENFIKADNKIKEILKEISNDENIIVRHKISFGNLKDEIKKHLIEIKPDIVVLGKRKPSLLSFLGDNMINFILKTHSGTIMLTDNKNLLSVNPNLSLGLLNNVNLSTTSFIEKFVYFTKKPVKSFQVISSKSSKKETAPSSKTAGFVFEKGDNKLKQLNNYLSTNNINLLFVNKGETTFKLSNFANKIDCSLILTN